MGSTYILWMDPVCQVAASKKHRNFEPDRAMGPFVRRGVVPTKTLELQYSSWFQLSTLRPQPLTTLGMDVVQTKPTEPNPPAGMVCLVLPGLLFFYTCRMQCRAKVGGLQQSLLSKGRGGSVCPGSG